MSGIGILNLKKVASTAGKVIAITKKLIGKKASPWELLPVAIELLSTAQGLIGVDFTALPNEVKDLDLMEAQEVTMALISGLKA